jgi:hypothetical protein
MVNQSALNWDIATTPLFFLQQYREKNFSAQKPKEWLKAVSTLYKKRLKLNSGDGNQSKPLNDKNDFFIDHVCLCMFINVVYKCCV